MKKTLLSQGRAYLTPRRALGFQLKSEGLRLLNLARFADARGHPGPLTNRLALNWACLPKSAERLDGARPWESVRPCAQHLLLTEPPTQIPPRHWLGPAHRRRPPSPLCDRTTPATAPARRTVEGPTSPPTGQTLIGLLAGSGLRIFEAMHLKLSDVGWKES